MGSENRGIQRRREAEGIANEMAKGSSRTAAEPPAEGPVSLDQSRWEVIGFSFLL